MPLPFPPDPRTGIYNRASRLYYCVKKVAENYLRIWLSALYEGDHVPPDRETIRQLARNHYDTRILSRSRQYPPGPHRDHREAPPPRLGAEPVQRMTVADVRKLTTRTERDGVGTRTRQLTLMRLKQMLACAVSMEYVKRNAAAAISRPANISDPAHAMSHAEFQALLDAAKYDHYCLLWLVYATTGMRRGEGLGLRWGDLDLDASTLYVGKQVSIVKSEHGVSRPGVGEVKSAAGRRFLMIDRATRDALVAHRDQDVSDSPIRIDPSLMFFTRHGTPHNPNNLYPSFSAICEDAGLDPKAWSIHDLPHTHASHLILAGVPIIEVSRRLGHADASITLRVYAHMVSDHQGKAVAAIEAALFDRFAVSFAVESGDGGESPQLDQ